MAAKIQNNTIISLLTISGSLVLGFFAAKLLSPSPTLLHSSSHYQIELRKDNWRKCALEETTGRDDSSIEEKWVCSNQVFYVVKRLQTNLRTY